MKITGQQLTLDILAVVDTSQLAATIKSLVSLHLTINTDVFVIPFLHKASINFGAFFA